MFYEHYTCFIMHSIKKNRCIHSCRRVVDGAEMSNITRMHEFNTTQQLTTRTQAARHNDLANYDATASVTGLCISQQIES